MNLPKNGNMILVSAPLKEIPNGKPCQNSCNSKKPLEYTDNPRSCDEAGQKEISVYKGDNSVIIVHGETDFPGPM
jgi:hypothetical protein